MKLYRVMDMTFNNYYVLAHDPIEALSKAKQYIKTASVIDEDGSLRSADTEIKTIELLTNEPIL